MCILTKAIRDEFINGLRQNYARELPTKQIRSVSDIMFGAKALYLSGTPFNNNGIGRQIRMEDPCALEAVLDPLCVKIWSYFSESPTPGCQADFDVFHEECCELFLERFRNEGITHTYGNAQKFINVLFKYLSCYDDAENVFAEKFRYCHMALDRYLYNGYRLPFYRDIVYTAIHREDPDELEVWSRLTKPVYQDIHTDIVSYMSGNPKTYNKYLSVAHTLSIFKNIPPLEEDMVLTPFEAEFFLWAIAKRCRKKDKNKKYIYPPSFLRQIKSLL